jgi:selenocysteine lyase/cysteine desulfurase
MATRREFLKDTALLGAALTAPLAVAPTRRVLPPLAPPQGTPAQVASDEVFWARVAEQYRVTDAVTNFEAGYFGLMATPVLEAYHRHIDRANRDNSYFARREYPALAEQARAKVAAFIDAPPATITFSRNATEALQALIGQYNRLRPGDTIVYADLDYPAMQQSMQALAARTGARLVTFDIPEPASRQGVLAAYARVLEANPATRLLLVTHCNNKTGLVLPVKDIAALAKPRGIDVVCDAAHSFGQIPLTMADLDADFVGLNLHKWIGAPVGAGVMYVRPEKLARIDRAHGDTGSLERIESRLHTGTMNFATILTVPDALDFQATIGMERKAARLRYLRDRWVAAVRGVPAINVLTPDESGMVGAITGVRLHGRGTREANQAIVRTLHDDYRLFTQWRTGLAKGDCVRITPALYNSAADADRLAGALIALSGPARAGAPLL